VELLSPFFERAQRLLQSLPGGFQLELAEALLNRGLAVPFLFLGVQFSAVALLHDPQLLLDDALLGLLPTLLKGVVRLSIASRCRRSSAAFRCSASISLPNCMTPIL